MKTAKLLTSATNYAVVHLPDRKFPGVVIQGDTLSSLVSGLETISTEIKNRNFEEAKDWADDWHGRLYNVLLYYVKICQDSEIDPPVDISN